MINGRHDSTGGLLSSEWQTHARDSASHLRNKLAVCLPWGASNASKLGRTGHSWTIEILTARSAFLKALYIYNLSLVGSTNVHSTGMADI